MYNIDKRHFQEIMWHWFCHTNDEMGRGVERVAIRWEEDWVVKIPEVLWSRCITLRYKNHEATKEQLLDVVNIWLEEFAEGKENCSDIIMDQNVMELDMFYDLQGVESEQLFTGIDAVFYWAGEPLAIICPWTPSIEYCSLHSRAINKSFLHLDPDEWYNLYHEINISAGGDTSGPGVCYECPYCDDEGDCNRFGCWISDLSETEAVGQAMVRALGYTTAVMEFIDLMDGAVDRHSSKLLLTDLHAGNIGWNGHSFKILDWGMCSSNK